MKWKGSCEWKQPFQPFCFFSVEVSMSTAVSNDAYFSYSNVMDWYVYQNMLEIEIKYAFFYNLSALWWHKKASLMNNTEICSRHYVL